MQSLVWRVRKGSLGDGRLCKLTLYLCKRHQARPTCEVAAINGGWS